MRNVSPAMLEMAEVEPWPEPVDGPALLDSVAGILRRFAVLPQWAPEALALFDLHTYAFHLREVSTYVGIESPEKRCGKTTLLGILGKLVNRPVMAANISSPAFFRVIQEMQPTLLIDEADTFLRRKSELRGILNAGNSRDTAYVMRVANQKGDRDQRDGVVASERHNTVTGLARFSCWCPKVMAAIGRLPETLADRCIIIRMQRKTVREECERLRDLEATTLRRQCARFVADHAPEIASARPAMPSSLNDREADFWEPLIALGDVVGGPWSELARQAAVGLMTSARENTPISSLLLDIWIQFLEANADRLFSRTIVAKLNRAVDRPWLELKGGKEITEIWLAKRLQPYDIRPRTIWIGEEHARGYLEKDFQILFHRYVPRSEVEALIEESKRANGNPEAKPGGAESVPEAPQPKDAAGGTEEAGCT